MEMKLSKFTYLTELGNNFVIYNSLHKKILVADADKKTEILQIIADPIHAEN